MQRAVLDLYFHAGVYPGRQEGCFLAPSSQRTGPDYPFCLCAKQWAMFHAAVPEAAFQGCVHKAAGARRGSKIYW